MPQVGGVLSSLKSGGFSFLAVTPWRGDVSFNRDPAPDEDIWVSRWIGGWQLCAPNTGLGGLSDSVPAFHGAASQDIWQVAEQTDSSLKLLWQSPDGTFAISRTWLLEAEQGVRVDTTMVNRASKSVHVGVAEHLILGTDFLLPITSGLQGQLEFSQDAEIVELDYSGAPAKAPTNSQELRNESELLSIEKPATVFGLSKPSLKSISVSVGPWRAQIGWDGLDHALIWKEFGYSQEAPWNGQVFALGIEPTNIPHGLGASETSGPFLESQSTLDWHTSLSFSKIGS